MSPQTLIMLALCMGMASAATFRTNCARMENVVNLEHLHPNLLAPTRADIGKCPIGCEPVELGPLGFLVVNEKRELVQQEINMVIEECKPVIPEKIMRLQH